MFGPARVMLQRFDQSCHFVVGWVDLKQLLRIMERGRDVSRIAAEADQREERIAINWMPSQVLFESNHRLVGTSSRVQSDGINISISRLIRVKFDCPVQFIERLV